MFCAQKKCAIFMTKITHCAESNNKALKGTSVIWLDLLTKNPDSD